MRIFSLLALSFGGVIAATALHGGELHPSLPLVLDLPLPTLPEIVLHQHPDWQLFAKPEREHKPWLIGKLNTEYIYLDGLPVRRDVALAFETGPLRGLYRAMTVHFFIAGTEWQPLVGHEKSSNQGWLFVGIRTKF